MWKLEKVLLLRFRHSSVISRGFEKNKYFCTSSVFKSDFQKSILYTLNETVFDFLDLWRVWKKLYKSKLYFWNYNEQYILPILKSIEYVVNCSKNICYISCVSINIEWPNSASIAKNHQNVHYFPIRNSVSIFSISFYGF